LKLLYKSLYCHKIQNLSSNRGLTRWSKVVIVQLTLKFGEIFCYKIVYRYRYYVLRRIRRSSSHYNFITSCTLEIISSLQIDADHTKLELRMFLVSLTALLPSSWSEHGGEVCCPTLWSACWRKTAGVSSCSWHWCGGGGIQASLTIPLHQCNSVELQTESGRLLSSA
jgi:hypothetical protein